MNTNAALSNESNMITTPWRVFSKNGEKFRIRATYGWRKIGNQEPYWSVTAEIQREINNRWIENSGGCLHDVIAKHFPALAPSIKWHLCDLSGGPMHYVANALYWYEKHLGFSKYPDKSDPEKALGNFKSTVVFGAVENDELPVPRYSLAESNGAIKTTLSAAGVEAWCMARLPAFLAKMKEETDAALALTIGGEQ